MNNEILGPDSVDPATLSKGDYIRKQKKVISLLKACKMYGAQGDYSSLHGKVNKLPTTPPEGFLNVNEKEKELPLMRLVGSKAACVRCATKSLVKSELETKLTHFICIDCRKDDNEWDFSRRIGGIAVTIGAMEADIKQYENVVGAIATDAN